MWLFTLLAESLRSFLDKSGKRKRLCRHLQVPLISRSVQLFGWVRQVLYWINQFYLCTHAYSGILLTRSAPTLHRKTNRVFSLTWPAYMQIYWNKRKRLHKKRVQLPEDWFGTPTWPPFHCFGTPIWPPWRHVKTLYSCRFNFMGEFWEHYRLNVQF